MDLRVRGEGFLIFGGTAGIGLAAARALAQDGASLFLVGRDPAKAESAAASLAETGSEVHVACTDLDRPGETEQLALQAVVALGGLRGMAITTGLAPRGQRDLESANDADWEATFRDVVLATARACKAVVPILVKGGGGAIVTTAAYSIRAPHPGLIAFLLSARASYISGALVNVDGGTDF